jgi:hypothetical protein
VRYYQAQDTFVAGLEDGTEKLVVKGEPYPETHELVKRDQAAGRKDENRIPLFRLLDEGEPVPRARAKPPLRAAAKADG